MHAYLDHASTTPMRSEAVSAMLPFLTEHFGNPSGSHSVARTARRALDDARDIVARDLGCEPGEVVFTSGGTEACNLAILGAHESPGDVVCSASEHHAVLRPSAASGGTIVGVDPRGRIDLAMLADALHPGIRLVSVMLANNEVGAVQPLTDATRLIRERAPDAVVHCDAVAAVGWLDVSSETRACDLVSVGAHKFGGPKGVGALVVRSGTRLRKLLHGGEQERGRRPGTQDVAGMVGMAAALEAATAASEEQSLRVGRLRDLLADGLLSSVQGAVETGVDPGGDRSERRDGRDGRATPDRSGKLASIFHVTFEGVDSEELLLLLDDVGICASAAAACASGAAEPSHVLLAMGFTRPRARSAVRFSLGATTSQDEIDYTLEMVPKLVAQIRR